MNILNDFYRLEVLVEGHQFSESGIYYQLLSESKHQVHEEVYGGKVSYCGCFLQVYVDYIRGLPINDTPEIFGLHENANITYAQNETFNMMSSILLLQPKSSSAGGTSREEVSRLVQYVIIYIMWKYSV